MPTPRRIRKPMPLKGRRTSFPADAIGQDYSPSCLNIRFKFGEVRNAPGRDILAGPSVTEQVAEIIQFSLLDGVTIWPVKFQQTKIERWGLNAPGTPGQWFNIIGNYTPSGSTGRWWTTVGENRLFFVQDTDGRIGQWDGIVGHNFDLVVATDGSVPKAKYLEYFNNRLVAAFTTEGGNIFANRIRWPRDGNYTKWDDTLGLGAGFLDITDENQESIRGIRGLNGELAIYTRRSIKHMIPTGTLDPTHIVITRVRGMGCDAPWTIASDGQRHFFLGYDHNVWSWDGISLTPVGNPVWEEIAALINPTNINTYFGKISIARGEYWLVIGTDVFVYDYRRDLWSRDSFPSLTALGEVEKAVNNLTWLQLVGSWAQQTLSWLQLAGGTITTLFGGRSDGATMLIDDMVTYDYFAIGSIMDRFLETEDMYLGYKELDPDAMRQGEVLRVELIYQYVTSDPFEVGVSFDRGNTWNTQLVVPVPLGISLVDFIATGVTARYRFRENNANGRFRWRSYEYEYIDTGDFIGTF